MYLNGRRTDSIPEDDDENHKKSSNLLTHLVKSIEES